MAKSKKPTDDDLTQDVVIPVTDDFVPEEVTFSSDEELSTEVASSQSGDFYDMGTIRTDDDKDKVDEEFEEAAKKLRTPVAEDDPEADPDTWVNEDLNLSDDDEFLDQEDYDSDNYGMYDDDN